MKVFALCSLIIATTFSPNVGSVQILGGSPLSSSPPPFSATDHPKQPSDFFGDVPGPYPTNNWWANTVLDSGTQVVNIFPFEAKTDDDGLHVCLPGKVVETNFVLSGYLDNWIIGAVENLGSRAITRGDLLSVTMRWDAGLEAPLVQGMPYVTLFYEGLTPSLTTIHAIMGVNGVSGGIVTDTRFEVELNNGQYWILYSSETITLSQSGTTLTATGPFFGSLRAAVALDLADTTLFDLYSSNIPLGGTVEASSIDDIATINFNWDTQGSGELLMMALPHHMDIISGVQTTSFTLNTLRGDMIGVVGDSWTLTEPLTTISWFSPREIDPTRLDDIVNALNEDINEEVQATDPYFGGKQMAKLARLALMAEEVGDDGLAQQYRDKLQPVLESWLDATNADPLVYDQSWGGIVSTDGVNDPNADFGQGFYNDHHFHYGYHIYAAAVLARADSSWGDRYNEKVLSLIRDVAEPSGADPYFTQTRMKDFYAGHSWANGIAVAFADSKNQESTSESVHGWYAIYLYGLATGDDRIKDLGRLLLSTEIRSSQKYWQITSQDVIYPAPFSDNKVVGILWSTKVDYTTWFGANVEFIHCIQMLPFVPISEELLPESWIQEEYPILEPAFSTASEGWRGYIIMAHAIIDKDMAWSEAQQLQSYDDGNTKSNTLYWIATRP